MSDEFKTVDEKEETKTVEEESETKAVSLQEILNKSFNTN